MMMMMMSLASWWMPLSWRMMRQAVGATCTQLLLLKVVVVWWQGVEDMPQGV